MSFQDAGPPLPDQRWSPMAALASPRTPLRRWVLASLLVHLLLILLGQRLVRPGSGGSGAGVGEAPPGVDRALPGTAGLPAGLRLGWVDLGAEPVPRPALGTMEPIPAPPPAAPPKELVLVPVETPAPVAEPEPVVAETPAAPATGGGAVAGPVGDPAPVAGGGAGAGGEGGGGGGGGDGSGAGGVTDEFVRGRDTLPVVQSMTVPDYPKSAKGKSRVPVVILVHVTAEGTVDDVRRGESTDCPPCEAAAIESAWKLRFTPGTRAGVPAAMWVRYPVTFGRK